MPSSTDNSRCPRCGGGFHCGASESRCDCFELKLSPTLRAELAQRYRGCLCLACLRELAAPSQAPAPGAST